MEERIKQVIEESISLKSNLLSELGEKFIFQVSDLIVSSINNGGKVLICGNGGSAADAQHFAAEFVGRFMKNRKALPAIALTTDTSILTAISNDFGFDSVFIRQVDALCTSKDILIGISTSGNSRNVIEAFKCAQSKGAKIVALLGNEGGLCAHYADYSYVVSSIESARIQEMHLVIEHLICEFVEKQFVFDEK
ncbi:D-sedoheptulose 7-phosphate isomerase [uncultured Bacteroides sp.]|uniref:D-sedoheptulose 7-phosphate isomerase n=1 Tax=uncultured Bacteroides sp. TaxID=162156 RepID=UPI002599C8E3|nr:D-sedoheptulose 7-phosphate isomerase [uncultured Bacteroides sp.]